MNRKSVADPKRTEYLTCEYLVKSPEKKSAKINLQRKALYF